MAPKIEAASVILQNPPANTENSSRWLKRLSDLFPALKNSNYRIYFWGQLVSLTGTWMQIVAQGWLVLELTNSAFLIGVVAALGSLPSLLFSLFGGVIVDRFPKRKILILTQASSMVLAFILGVLTVMHKINVTEVGILAFLLGVVNAVDAPARQAFAVEMVGKKDLASAIALNAGVFNGARVIGPSIAGFLIGFIGTGGAFIVNGATYIAVIIALLMMKIKEFTNVTEIHPIQAIKEGLLYSYNHPLIKNLLIFTAFISVFGWSYTTIMPYIAKHTFGFEATGLGYLYAATGLGALLATVLVSGFSTKIPTGVFLIGGNVLFCISIILFTFTNKIFFALPILFLAGLGLLSIFATLNTTIQHQVEDKYRGRVMSIYMLLFLGLFPFGNFQIGYVSEHFSPAIAIRLGAVICLLAGTVLFLNRSKIRRQHDAYQKARA